MIRMSGTATAYDPAKQPKGDLPEVTIHEQEPQPPRYVVVEHIEKEEKEASMKPTKRQLEIYEVTTDDGGVALQFGDGPLQMGVDESDLMRLLAQVFDLPESPSFIDAELYDLANTYLDEDAARARSEELRA